MRQGSVFSRAAAAAVIVFAVAAGAGAARAENVMAACAGQWKEAKTAGTTGGATWPEFLSKCRAQRAEAAPAPAQPAPAPTQTAGGGSVMAACASQWSQAKATGTTGGATWPEFLAKCRKGSASAAPAPAPSQGGSSWWQPAPSQNPAPAPTGAGQFRAAAEAQARCPADTVVWVNTNSKIYHTQGSHWYARTQKGAFMCEADAKAAGDRAARRAFGFSQK